MIAWKEYLEWLEQKPFSTMTTREIADAIYDSRLADARISYSGTGELANSNQMGWLSQFFNSPIWPF